MRWYRRVTLSAGKRVLSGFSGELGSDLCCELGSALHSELGSDLHSELCGYLNYLPTQGAPVPYVYPVVGESGTDQ